MTEMVEQTPAEMATDTPANAEMAAASAVLLRLSAPCATLF